MSVEQGQDKDEQSSVSPDAKRNTGILVERALVYCSSIFNGNTWHLPSVPSACVSGVTSSRRISEGVQLLASLSTPFLLLSKRLEQDQKTRQIGASPWIQGQSSNYPFGITKMSYHFICYLCLHVNFTAHSWYPIIKWKCIKRTMRNGSWLDQGWCSRAASTKLQRMEHSRLKRAWTYALV